jgi:NAD-dependent deacetylase
MDASIPTGIIDAFKRASRVAVLTGAGISAESGVPTFREAQSGLWAQYDPHELATPEAFAKDPRLVWAWYAWRRKLVAQAQPNPGHTALAELEAISPRFSLITQNVDGLHRAAGSDAIIELHGNLTRVKCVGHGHRFESWQDAPHPPACPRCGTLLRPDVVWFGETLPGAALSDAIRASEQSDLFLAVGTSAVVQPAASLPMVAARNGAVTVEVNLMPTPISQHVDYTLRGRAATILPRLVHAWRLSRSPED